VKDTNIFLKFFMGFRVPSIRQLLVIVIFQKSTFFFSLRTISQSYEVYGFEPVPLSNVPSDLLKFPVCNIFPAIIYVWNAMYEICANTYFKGKFMRAPSFLVCAHLMIVGYIYGLTPKIDTKGFSMESVTIFHAF